jgi:hypothetical protein
VEIRLRIKAVWEIKESAYKSMRMCTIWINVKHLPGITPLRWFDWNSFSWPFWNGHWLWFLCQRRWPDVIVISRGDVQTSLWRACSSSSFYFPIDMARGWANNPSTAHFTINERALFFMVFARLA